MDSLIIDNTGFDIDAMSALTEQEFIDTHKDTEGIGHRGLTGPQKVKWLKDAYKSIKEAATAAKKEKVVEKK